MLRVVSMSLHDAGDCFGGSTCSSSWRNRQELGLAECKCQEAPPLQRWGPCKHNAVFKLQDCYIRHMLNLLNDDRVVWQLHRADSAVLASRTACQDLAGAVHGQHCAGQSHNNCSSYNSTRISSSRSVSAHASHRWSDQPIISHIRQHAC